MQNQIFGALLALATLSSFATTAQAGVISQVQTDFSTPFSFNPFDGALGTLTGVNVSANLSANFSGEDPFDLCVPVDDCSGTINLTVGTVGGALGGTGEKRSRDISNQEVDDGFDYTLSIVGAINPANLSDFLSPNFIGISEVKSFAEGDLADDNFNGLIVGDPMGTVTLRYTFDEAGSVPAPATLALFGLGLAGLGWSRREKV